MKDRGEALRRARELRRLSRADLAALTGVGARTITRIETGKGSGTARTIDALERELAPELRHLTGANTDRDRTLASYGYHELLAELSRRYGELEARLKQASTAADATEVVEWSTSDAPSRRRPRDGDERPTGSDRQG